jgi:hypothetical protein
MAAGAAAGTVAGPVGTVVGAYLSAKVRALIDFLRQRFGPRPYWEVDDHRMCAIAHPEPVAG